MGLEQIFLDFVIEEKVYLCVQTLTHVDLYCFCLSVDVKEWTGFWILNKLFFIPTVFNTAVLPFCHLVSLESLLEVHNFQFSLICIAPLQSEFSVAAFLQLNIFKVFVNTERL